MEDKNWKLVDERGVYTPNPRWVVKADDQCVNGVKHWSVNIYFKNECGKEEYRGTIVEEIQTREQAVERMESWLDTDPVIID